MTGLDNKPDGAGANRETPPGMPRWVKVSGLIVLAVLVVLVVIMLLVGGEHGPGLHTGGVDTAGMFSWIAWGGPFVL